MIGIQVITHGQMAEGMIDSADMIIGDTEKVAFNSLKRAQDIEEFREEVKQTTNELMSEDGVLILVDMFGASPYNTALLNSRDIEGPYKVVTGVNLPMLIEATMYRATMDIDELYEKLLESSKEAVMGWGKEQNE